MLVLPRSTLHCDAEDVKRWIVEDCAKFILKPSRKIGATYKILYFRSASMGDIKIDILLPGTTHLPALPLDRIVHSDPIKVQGKTYTLPLAPPALLLLFKLQAWSDRLTEYRFRTKCELDASDLRCMLKLKAVTDLRTTQPWHDRSLFSSTFEMLTKGRVERFCARFPQCRNDWKSLGFDTGPELRGSSLYLDFQNLRI